ncbi:hypothetical protein TH25_22190 [Thalassospira profundimaris]|uniref:Uncharacterized protein n=1 Tax=Thalassospira profundimaris TaxID=502049 RepID=A0A367WNU4_9PROT|nr:hypothetical protein TH25_22190 [Thalassospira profundimaris]
MLVNYFLRLTGASTAVLPIVLLPEVFSENSMKNHIYMSILSSDNPDRNTQTSCAKLHMSEYRRRTKFRLKYIPTIEKYWKYFLNGDPSTRRKTA